ncbi:MAG: hypothetical protein ACRCV9_20125 [Burkholderiaceae bacterium]
MKDIDLVGPSYDLDSAPSGVQRTINLVPVPVEPGNERTAWVLEDVPGLTSFSTAPVVPALDITLVSQSLSGFYTWALQFSATGGYTGNLTLTLTAPNPAYQASYGVYLPPFPAQSLQIAFSGGTSAPFNMTLDEGGQFPSTGLAYEFQVSGAPLPAPVTYRASPNYTSAWVRL